MLTQAKSLVNLMRQSSRIDFANSWKLVTFFVGGNDLCKSCKDVCKLIFFFILKKFKLFLN